MEKNNKKSVIIVVAIIAVLLLALVIYLMVKSNSDNEGDKGLDVPKEEVSFIDSIKNETVTAETYEDISNRIGAELDKEDELYYFSYAVMYYMAKDGLAAAFTNPDDESAMYASIYNKTVGQLIAEGKELMEQNDMTVEKFKESLKTASEGN